MITFELLDYGIYADGKHIADFDDIEHAKTFSREFIRESDATNVTVINNFTGEVAATYDEVTEVKVKIKEWVAD